MSTPAQKANLARIRDNQRRSRARRREYLQELEQRLRLCELQGIEATAEVQIAARRVADENRQLRQLLNEHGFSQEYINRFLQAGNVVAAGGPGMNHRQAFAAAAAATGEPSMASHALQQALVPRRPASLEPNVPFTSVTSQVMSDSSISSTPSVSTSTPWDAMPAESSYSHNPGMHLQTTALASQSSQQQQQQQYPAAMFMTNQNRGPEAYLNQSAHLGSLASTSGITQSMLQQQQQQQQQHHQHGRGHMHYDGSMNNYHTEDDSSYGDGSTGGWPG
ncbi:hypothetical protein HC256_002841 [Beauveria bassiana]|nr:hypothetical protein HC256_002841 [Beauveria bassiana]